MASTSAAEPSALNPNWLEMPPELMENILQRVGTVEIFTSSRKVCTTWRRIYNDPAMWKVIVVRKSFALQDEWDTEYILQMLTKKAVDLSCEELIDISIDFFGNDDLLDHIVLRSSKLKSLCLMHCLSVVTDSGLIRAVKKVPHLVTLELTYTSMKGKDIEVIGHNCPQLKSFILTKSGGICINCDDHAFSIANDMPDLRHLKVSDGGMTNYRLKAILDGCPHLESLDVLKCRNLYLGGNLGKLCMERIEDFKHDSM